MSDFFSTYVPPVGPKDARIMILGESPGRDEVAAKTPFVGQAGKLLNTLLTSAGLDRAELYITNTVKFAPQGNKEEFFFSTRGKGKDETRTPTKAYMDGIVELVGEIREVKPNVIVPLGNYALWALTQKWGISKFRGSILESTLVRGTKVIPTFHPAFYLHDESGGGNPNKKLLGNWDFIRIAQQALFPEIRRKRRDFITNPSAEQIEAALERYTDPSLDHLTMDTEWYSPNDLAYVGFCDNDEEAICVVPDSMLAFRAIKEICGTKIPKVWQNAMFDAVALWRKGIKVENVAHDTMIAWFLCWGTIIEQKGLDVITSVLTEEPYYKDEVEFVGRDEERGQIYCCTDCVTTDEAWTKLRDEEFPLTETRRGYDISMSVMNTFIRASQVGILVDTDKLIQLQDKYLYDADEAEASLKSLTGQTFNPRSWQQVQRIVYRDLGLGKRFTSESTDQNTLMDIAATLSAEGGHDHEVDVLKKIIRSRQNRNIVSRYITRKILDRDDRARCFWNLAGTKNGRLSTTAPWWPGLALQTVPDEAREMFIPDPGHVFVGWDLAQAEARVVAVLSGNFELLDAMDSGIDIHCMLAPILGMTYEDLMAEVKRVGKDACKPRQLLKVTRHASNYFLLWFGLKMRINREFIDTDVGVDAATAKVLSAGYLEQNPGLPGWWATVLQQMKSGFIENAFGRRRNFHGYFKYGDHEHRDGIAFYPQSTIADLTTLSIADVDRAAEWTLPLLHMHDGALIQVPEDRKDEAIALLKKATDKEFFVEGHPLKIPVDFKVGYDWKNLGKAS